MSIDLGSERRIQVRSIEAELKGVFVEVEYELISEQAAVFSSVFGNWLPGEPREARIRHVWVGIEPTRIDILSALDDATMERIELLICSADEGE